MAQQLSKSDQIRKLLHLKNKEIVQLTGFNKDLVSLVRSRTSRDGMPKRRETDVAADEAKMARYRADPNYAARVQARIRKWRSKNIEKIRARDRIRKARLRRTRAEARAS